MQSAFERSPVINSPFRKPERRFHLNSDGSPTGVIKDGRRPSAYLVPISPASKAIFAWLDGDRPSMAA